MCLFWDAGARADRRDPGWVRLYAPRLPVNVCTILVLCDLWCQLSIVRRNLLWLSSCSRRVDRPRGAPDRWSRSHGPLAVGDCALLWHCPMAGSKFSDHTKYCRFGLFAGQKTNAIASESSGDVFAFPISLPNGDSCCAVDARALCLRLKERFVNLWRSIHRHPFFTAGRGCRRRLDDKPAILGWTCPFQHSASPAYHLFNLCWLPRWWTLRC